MLTGLQALHFADIAKIASEVLGRNVERESVGDGAWHAGLLSHGIPKMMADGLGSP